MREACSLRMKNEERWAFNDFSGMCLHLLLAYSDVKPTPRAYADRSQSGGWWLEQRPMGVWSLNMFFVASQVGQ